MRKLPPSYIHPLFAAGAGERHDAPEEAAGGAGGHEAALPSNRAEGGGPTGEAGAGRHQEPTQQVKSDDERIRRKETRRSQRMKNKNSY